jgi:hypothetical protein
MHSCLLQGYPALQSYQPGGKLRRISYAGLQPLKILKISLTGLSGIGSSTGERNYSELVVSQERQMNGAPYFT